jgi:multiple sugar transport system permease protein
MATYPLRQPAAREPLLGRQLRRFTGRAAMTFLAVAVLSGFLLPLAYMTLTALKDQQQITDQSAPWYPSTPQTFVYQGTPYPILQVPLDDGVRPLAIITKGREDSVFIDPANPDAGPIQWHGRWRTLEAASVFDPKVENFSRAWDEVQFPKLFRNTVLISALGTIGAVLSAIAVAYGFSRFRFRFRGGLFLVLLATIMLSQQATLVPSYIIFSRIGWAGTWLPLIVPHFFANAYNVFLLRQYFMSIPRELDEAAMIDGASPFRILRSVIVPQAIPAITAVALFHFFYSWNEFLLALVYVGGKPDLWPLTLGIQQFAALFVTRVPLVQASAILTIVVPILIFFLAQRAFMRGVVVTGVEK